jgi:hypothetical protein
MLRISLRIVFVSHNEIGKKVTVIVGDLQKSLSKSETRMCISAVRTAVNIVAVQEEVVSSPKNQLVDDPMNCRFLRLHCIGL